jgi:hypothetical protein
MSAKQDDILESIVSLINEREKGSVENVISLFWSYRPKIKIDAEFKKSLRKTLLAKKPKSFLSLQFPSYRFFWTVGILCTSFIAIVWFYKFWWDISKPLWEENSIQISQWSSDGMYSEAKATFSTNLDGTPPSSPSNTPEETTKKRAIIQNFHAEKASIDAEIADINNDVFDITREVSNISDNGSEVSWNMKAIPLEKTQAPIVQWWISETTQKIPWEFFHTPSMMTIAPSVNVSEDTKNEDITTPSYPSTMNIYIKPEPWTSEEIDSRSGSGLIVKEVSTERYSIIDNKYRVALWWAKGINAKIIYKSHVKILRNTTPSFYLIPSMEYTLENGEKIYIPLIRWYQ